MAKKILVGTAFAALTLFVLTTTVNASSPAAPTSSEPAKIESPIAATQELTASFDCGELNTTQLTDLQNKSSSSGLRDLAKRCDEQAEEYEAKAKDALQANSKADVSFLREKAANAYMNVAVFTNSSLFKN